MSARRRARFLAPVVRSEPRRHAAAAGMLAAGALFAAVASGARPFTVPADMAVSVPSALFAGALVMQRIRPDAGPWRRMGRARDGEGHTSAVPWLVVIAVLVGVELASYFHSGPRADYPTLSSGAETLFHFRAAEAAAWLVWLTVGWYLSRR